MTYYECTACGRNILAAVNSVRIAAQKERKCARCCRKYREKQIEIASWRRAAVRKKERGW